MQIRDTIDLPEKFAEIPRDVLTFGPSPIQLLPRMSKDLGIKVHAKREDVNSGLAFGGNKIRKLEYLLAEALQKQCDVLVSIGGLQSNHTRAVAAVAAHHGLDCELVNENWVPYDEATETLAKKVGNMQLSRLMGATINLNANDFGIEHKSSAAEIVQSLEKTGRRPYYIPAGASDHPLGGLGFARFAFEVVQQEAQMGLFFDTVIVCAVTGSTFAGMLAGFRLYESQGGKKRRVIGIDASAKPEATLKQVVRIANFTGEKIGLPAESFESGDIEFKTQYHDGCYGLAGGETKEAIRYGARMDGFITDPVYEGKSLRGMIAMVRDGEIAQGSTVLYAHLGGQLALNTYANEL